MTTVSKEVFAMVELKAAARAAQRKVSSLNEQIAMQQLENALAAAEVQGGDPSEAETRVRGILATIEGQFPALETELARLKQAGAQAAHGRDFDTVVTAYCKSHDGLDAKNADDRMTAYKAMIKSGAVQESDFLEVPERG